MKKIFFGVPSYQNLPTPHRNLDRDLENSVKRWRMYCECEAPEKEKLPGDWKGKSDVQRLVIMRALRPDRMTHAMQ